MIVSGKAEGDEHKWKEPKGAMFAVSCNDWPAGVYVCYNIQTCSDNIVTLYIVICDSEYNVFVFRCILP